MASAFDTAGKQAHADSSTGGRSLGEQSHRVVSEVQELGRVALDNAGQAAARLREKGSEALEHGRENAVKAKGELDRVISANPMKSVLIAAGVGAALGFVLSRKMR